MAANTPSLDDITALFDKWFAETCFGGVVARNTEVYNFLFEARDKLKARFAVAFGASDPTPPSSALKAESIPAAKSSGAN